MEEEHPNDSVARLVHVEEVNERVHTRRKTTIEPTTTLSDELRRGLRHVGFRLARLDVSQGPGIIGLCDELETKDTILGQEHVLLRRVRSGNWKQKDVHTLVKMFIP